MKRSPNSIGKWKDFRIEQGKHEIRAVTFDLWETLLLERDGASSQRNSIRCNNLARVFKEFGIDVSAQQIMSTMETMFSWLVSVWEKNYEVTHLDQIRFIDEAASNGSAVPKEEWLEKLSSAYVSPVFELPPYLNPDAVRLLQWLKNKDKKTGLICNVGMTPGFVLRRFLRKEGVEEYFDVMIFSDEVGVRKPKPEIFHLAAERLGVKPYETVHIGDNLKSDVWGAKNAGLKAIYLSSEIGRDRIAESDPKSLVSISRKLGDVSEENIVPDKTITSLAMAMKAIEELET